MPFCCCCCLLQCSSFAVDAVAADPVHTFAPAPAQDVDKLKCGTTEDIFCDNKATYCFSV